MSLIHDAARDGVFTAAVLHVQDLRRGAPVFVHAHGRTANPAHDIPVTPAARFDLASLTKLVTSTVALRLAARGVLDLDAPVADVLGDRLTPRHRGATARHLLAHTAGLLAWRPLWEEGDVLDAALATPPDVDPGTRYRYTDVGFLWLGALLEVLGGASLDALARAEVLGPLGMGATRYHPLPAAPDPGVVATEICPERGLLVGAVSDRNTWHLGGIAPQAGLFGPADDLARFAQGWWDAPSTGFLPEELRDEAWGPPPIPGGHVLGWDTVAPEGYTSAGRLLSPRSHGHLAFTGPSLWVDPDRGIAVIFLCNRIHPTRDEPRLRDLRPALHDAVARAVDSV